MFNKSPKITTFFSLITLSSIFISPQYAGAGLFLVQQPTEQSESMLILPQGDSLAVLGNRALIQIAAPEIPKAVTNRWVIVTAYSSTIDQTDSTPFVTALGTEVRDGIVACNFLKFGTKVRIPQLFGNKVFVVEDRMAKKNSHKIDIWFASREQALEFGVKKLKVEILET